MSENMAAGPSAVTTTGGRGAVFRIGTNGPPASFAWQTCPSFIRPPGERKVAVTADRLGGVAYGDVRCGASLTCMASVFRSSLRALLYALLYPQVSVSHARHRAAWQLQGDFAPLWAFCGHETEYLLVLSRHPRLHLLVLHLDANAASVLALASASI